MKIVTLVEDQLGENGLGQEHGVSFYLETEHHKVLFDLGQSDLFLRNADQLKISLEDVDTVVISHGHYDHGGGLRFFLERNKSAKVYLQKAAFGAYYSMRSEAQYTYIGLDQMLDLSRFVCLDGDYAIDEELKLIQHIDDADCFPKSNQTLFQKVDDLMVHDDFLHEQSLLVQTDFTSVLIAGCAHKGIVNIVTQALKNPGIRPLDLVLSGFHLEARQRRFEEETKTIETIARRLLELPVGRYCTGHCTGRAAYEVLKPIMNDRLTLFYPGMTIQT